MGSCNDCALGWCRISRKDCKGPVSVDELFERHRGKCIDIISPEEGNEKLNEIISKVNRLIEKHNSQV
jgi:hypothetical protein